MIGRRRGFNLVEVLVGATILGIVGIPVLQVFITSKSGIVRTDVKREARYYVGEILAHLGRQSLHDLWRYQGPGEIVGWDVAGQLRHRLCEYDERSGKITGKNPLGFTDEFMQELIADRLDARVFFEFYTRAELQVEPLQYQPSVTDTVSPLFGLHHMQAGWAQIYLLDRNHLAAHPGDEKGAVTYAWKQPVMCPAIVGRPGLKLSGCPAVSPKVRAVYEPLLRRREATL